MPTEEPAVSAEQPSVPPAVEQAAAHPSTVAARQAYEPIEEEDWLEEPEELPRRPRRRLLGSGGNPVFLGLLALLLIACGFIGGVLVEKGQESTTSSGSPTGGAGSALLSRFRGLREGAGSSGAASAAGSSRATSSSTAGFARPTAGTVAFLAGSTLYVTNAEGNTVKVATSHATAVTKSVKSSVRDIHPGETVTVTGETGSNGSVSAESIDVGGSGGGGLAALFGAGAGGTGSGGRGGTGGKGAGGGEPSLFGGG